MQKKFTWKLKEARYSNKIKNENYLLAQIATIITLLIPTLYVIGRVYYETYLSEFGVSPDLFLLDTDDYIYKSLESIFQNISLVLTAGDGLKAFLWSLTVSAYLAFLLLIGSISRTKKFNYFLNFLKIAIRNRYFKIIGVISLGPLALISFLIIFFSLTISLLVPIILGISGGKESAKNEMKLLDCHIRESNNLQTCQTIKINDGSLIRGRVIAASDNYLAIVSLDGARIVQKDKVEILSNYQPN